MDLETLKEEVRARADIVDIVGRVVKLQRASGSWKGLCPFHQEKTPSFNVNPQRQSYHCFGCGAGGDVFKFVMEYEHLDFMAALERLANQVGVAFELDGAKGGGSAKRRLLDLHEQAAAFFEAQYADHATGAHARDYVAERQLREETPAAYRFGFAPDGFEVLLARAREWGFTETELENSGLFGIRDTPRDGERLYDRFRNRLMFPILDEQSRVIGFSGRVIPPGEAKAKYMNSPETLLFKKSRVLYGIDKARKPMTEARRAVLCEGQLDVIRCHESGIPEAVAAQGTAVTEEHARILKRYADEVVLLLDADTAGVKAALRSAEVLLAEGVTIRVAALPEGGDPDDVVRTQGPAKLREIVNRADSFVVFQIRTLVAREGEITETSRLRVAREVMRTIAMAREEVHREELVRQAAGALGMREDALRADLRRTEAEARSVRPTPPPRPGPAAAPRPATPSAGTSTGKPPAAEQLLIELLCAYPEERATAEAYLRPEHLTHAGLRDMLELLYSLSAPTREALLDAARDHPAGEELIALDQRSRLNIEGDLGTPEEALRNLVVRLRREALIRTRAALMAREESADPDQRHAREMQLFQLTGWIGHLRAFSPHPAKPLEWEKARTLIELIDQQERV